jgi:Cof subfamily protein (haloacid dehalogenase superfamily)
MNGPGTRASGAPSRRIRLVALDLDGTLVGDDMRIRPRTVAAVRAAVDAGVAVAIVTGRMSTSALPYARELGLREPIVGMQGALIRSMPAPDRPGLGRLLYHRPLPAAAARDALAWCRAHGLDPHLNHLEKMVIPASDSRAAEYVRFNFGRVVVVPDLDAWVRHPVTKVISVGDAPTPTRLLPAARADFDGRAVVTVSHPMFLEFVAPGVSKGAAVRWLARRLGVDLRDTLAIGDQLNDLEMIAEVGFGVAMPHGPAELQAAASLVARPFDEDGAAQVLETYVLGSRPGARRAERPGTFG